MTEEEKNAIEYLKTRLYGNEGCRFIDVAQGDLRIFLDLVEEQDTEINKLNNVIDRMAKKLSQVPMYRFKSKDNTYRAENIDMVAMTVDEIKDYFMY